MKNIAQSIYFKIFSVLFIGFISYTLWKKDDDYYIRMCDSVVNQSIKGKVAGMGGHGMYQWIMINDKTFDVNFSDIKYTNGITDKYIDIRIGDSIFKNPNSNEIEIRRGNKSAIFILDCKIKM